MPDYQTPDPVYAEILRALGVPQETIASGGWFNGIPTNPSVRPANITPAMWTSRPKSAGLPGWAQQIIGVTPKLSPENRSKQFRHWVNQEGIAPQWKDVAAARPAWATELVREQFRALGVTG